MEDKTALSDMWTYEDKKKDSDLCILHGLNVIVGLIKVEGLLHQALSLLLVPVCVCL